jgi:carboxypeptidase family protein
MNAKFKLPRWCAVAIVSALLTSHSTQAQSGVALSGTVTSASGAAVPGARISAKNLNTGQSTELQADAAGHFDFAAPAPAEFEITAVADGFDSKTVKVTLIPGAAEAVSFTLTAIPGWTPPPQTNLPTAPSSSQSGPSLSDLGFPAEQTQGSAKQQALLDKRTHMLKIHQKLGLITVAPLLATLIASPGAGGKSTSNTDRTVHMVLGAVTSDLYFTSAYFAIRAPRVPGTTARGPIRLHKALAWVHGPGMILTPILGALAYEQKNKGEKVHGIASAHGPVAAVTAAAFGAALLSVSVKF